MPYARLGSLQTGSTQPTEFAVYGFQGGLNVKGAPQLIADDELTIALNGYLRADGAFTMRNGMAKYGTATAGTSSPYYLSRFYQEVKNGAVVSNKATLAVFNGNLYTVPSSGAATLVGSVGGSSVVNPTFTRIQDPNDPNFPAGLTDVTVICTGVNGPYVYDGTNLYTPAGWSTASGAQWCATVNGILWFGGIAKYPNQVFGTGDGIIASMESLPAYRNFVLSAPVTGLVAQGSGATASLVIGRNSGLSVLYGTGPSTFSLQDIPFEDGVVAGRSMTSWNGMVYFLGRNAVYRFDGQTEPQQISQKIEPWILNDPYTNGYPFTQNQQNAWAQVYNNRLHIGYCSSSTTLNTIAVFDLIVGGWTVLQTTPGIGSMILLDAPTDASPYQALVGSATTGQAYYWDYVNTSALTSAITDDGTAVLAQVQTKYFKLGVPGTNKRLERFYPEFQVAGSFIANFTVSTDYGNTTTAVASETPTNTGNVLIWDQGLWDVNVWGGTALANFGPPQSRIDFDGLQAEAFAFGITMTSALAPWTWVGGSGVFTQAGRT